MLVLVAGAGLGGAPPVKIIEDDGHGADQR